MGVEPKLSIPNSRRMMTLRLPPSPNWSQLESRSPGLATLKNQLFAIPRVEAESQTRYNVWTTHIKEQCIPITCTAAFESYAPSINFPETACATYLKKLRSKSARSM